MITNIICTLAATLTIGGYTIPRSYEVPGKLVKSEPGFWLVDFSYEYPELKGKLVKVPFNQCEKDN